MTESTQPRHSAAREVVSLYLAGAALFGGIAAIFYHPARIGLASIAVALVAAGMAAGTKHQRFAGLATFGAVFGWLVGMVVGVMLDRAIF